MAVRPGTPLRVVFPADWPGSTLWRRRTARTQLPRLSLPASPISKCETCPERKAAPEGEAEAAPAPEGKAVPEREAEAASLTA